MLLGVGRFPLWGDRVQIADQRVGISWKRISSIVPSQQELLLVTGTAHPGSCDVVPKHGVACLLACLVGEANSGKEDAKTLPRSTCGGGALKRLFGGWCICVLCLRCCCCCLQRNMMVVVAMVELMTRSRVRGERRVKPFLLRFKRMGGVRLLDS